MSGRDCTRIAFAADIEGEMVIDALDGTGTNQVIERRQASRVIART